MLIYHRLYIKVGHRLESVCLYRDEWKNDPLAHFIHDLSKYLPSGFIVSACSLKFYLIQPKDHLLNC